MRLRERKALRAAAALAATTALASAATGWLSTAAAKAPKPKVVSVADFYFGPSALTIHKGETIKWVWAPTNVESHDVHLKKGPNGLKKKGTYSTKTSAVTNATFKKSFPTAGTYRFICTLHPSKMKLTVTVKK
jgi:plastocyanin